jgi:hydroxyquinol 1,2-dioxygenase
LRDLNETTITDEVISRFSGNMNPRLRQVSEAMVRHLHAFVREVEPTQAEWVTAIDFLTRTGHMCDDKRQEFILLSDVLGVSTLVDSINHRMPAGATETTVLGPFYVENPKAFPLGADLSPGLKGDLLIVAGTVSDVEGAPISGAIIDVWHSDGDGFYDVQSLDDLAMRGRLVADEQGGYWFRSINPSCYPIPNDGPVGQLLESQGRHPFRPAHVHFMISAPGFETLVTHVFADGDKYLDSDVVFGVKNTLIREFVRREHGQAPDGGAIDSPHFYLQYDFRLKAEASRIAA